MPDLVAAPVGVFVAALASAGAAVTVLLLPPAIQRLPEEGIGSFAGVLIAYPLIGIPMAAIIFIFAFVPAIALLIIAEGRHWRHPAIYTVAGGGVGIGLTLTTNLISSPAAGDRLTGYVVAASGLLAG